MSPSWPTSCAPWDDGWCCFPATSVIPCPARLVHELADQLGPVDGLVMSHCESVDSSILDTTVTSFDRHYAVNVRATWLLMKAFAEQCPGSGGAIVAPTSDHTVHNLPYGVTKGALDSPGVGGRSRAGRSSDPHQRDQPRTDRHRVDGRRDPRRLRRPGARRAWGRPRHVADLVRFLFSDRGGWINGQLLYSNGGFATFAVTICRIRERWSTWPGVESIIEWTTAIEWRIRASKRSSTSLMQASPIPWTAIARMRGAPGPSSAGAATDSVAGSHVPIVRPTGSRGRRAVPRR